MYSFLDKFISAFRATLSAVWELTDNATVPLQCYHNHGQLHTVKRIITIYNVLLTKVVIIWSKIQKNSNIVKYIITL